MKRGFRRLGPFLDDIFKEGAVKEFMSDMKMAKKHGGGGHKGAAGFVCQNLPFSRAVPIPPSESILEKEMNITKEE